jgi:hypothetical protein
VQQLLLELQVQEQAQEHQLAEEHFQALKQVKAN